MLLPKTSAHGAHRLMRCTVFAMRCDDEEIREREDAGIWSDFVFGNLTRAPPQAFPGFVILHCLLLSHTKGDCYKFRGGGGGDGGGGGCLGCSSCLNFPIRE